MRFEDALYDGTDPLYAPLTSKRGKHLHWRPSPRYVRMGASGKTHRLPGEIGDGRDKERAAVARQMTRDLLEQFGETPEVAAGTWSWLIRKYLHDQYSPIQDVKQNTRADYEFCVNRWNEALGRMTIGSLDYEAVKKIEAAMFAKGRTVSYVSRMFNRLRGLVRYGVAIRAPGAVDVQQVLSSIRFKTPPKKTKAPTEEQIMAMVAEADRRGLHDFATGMLLQWWLGLRSVDIRGQWFEVENSATGGLIRHSTVKRRTGTHTRTTRWQDGLTWDMISGDFTRIEKVISKTASMNPDPTVFHLDQLPDVQDRLRKLAERGRVGPVILSNDGLPYTTTGWSQAHRRIRKHLGLPDHVKNMDTRAGAITHAQQMGATLEDMRDQATHSTTATTQRYMRGGELARDRVIKLRKK